MITKVETGLLIDIEEVQRYRVNHLNGIIGTVNQFSEQGHRFFPSLTRRDVPAHPHQFDRYTVLDDHIHNLMQPHASAVRCNHAVLKLVVPLFLYGLFREGHGALAILRMEVLDPKRRVFQPTCNWISEDLFHVFVYESSPESTRLCPPHYGSN